jgi:hypothetical protein
LLSRTIISALGVCAAESAGYGRPTAVEAGRQTSNGSLMAGIVPPTRLSGRSNIMEERSRDFSASALHRVGAAAINEFRADRDSVPVLRLKPYHTLPNGAAFEATSVDAGIPDLWRVRCPGCHAGSDRRSGRTEAATERAAGDKKADGGLPDLAKDGPHGSMRNNARFGYGMPHINAYSWRPRGVVTELRPAMAAANRLAEIPNRRSGFGQARNDCGNV